MLHYIHGISIVKIMKYYEYQLSYEWQHQIYLEAKCHWVRKLENFPSQQKQAKREALLPYYCFTMYRWHKISFVHEQCSLSICSH